MKRVARSVSLFCILAGGLLLSDCSSSTPTLTLLGMGSATPEIDDGQSITINATTNSSQGVTWALTGLGALSNNTSTSVTYTAPANADTTVTVTATLVSDTSQSKSITIKVFAAPSITTTSLGGGVVGTAYTGQITAVEGAPALTYSISTGSLPAGLMLNSSTGAITGTPTGPASATPVSFTAKVTDSSTAGAQSATKALSIIISQAPAITSANNTTFLVSTKGSFAVTATGVPTPSLSDGGATLPSGVTFVDNGNGTGTLSGTPAAGTAGSYAITFTASNGVGTAATQNFTLTVGQAPAITSAGSTTFTVGTNGSFTVTTSGFPKPALSETGALPSGVTFVDNGNGTATLSGTAAAGTGKKYTITITASNGVGSNATQSFTLTVNETPAITSANKTTFTLSTLGTFNVTTSGFPTPSIVESGVLPAGVTFVDNGNGTGTLAGTPAAGTAGSYPITFTPSNGVGLPVAQNFTLTVGQAPAITSGNSTTFTVGAAGTFSVTTSGFPKPAISDGAATLPSGVTFVDNGNGTATLSGTPAAGTGGTYTFTITASNGVGSNATQTFTLTVDQAPAITSANNATFSVGGAGTFTVTTSGFPKPAISDGGAALPSGVTFTDNGNGTGTLSGTPASGSNGTYPITFTASNGVSPNATQPFTLTVDTAPVITSANNTTFTVGTAGSFTVTATGNPTPTVSESGALPSGVTFTAGTGSGTLTGTPAAGTGGTYTITFTASNGVGTPASQTFTLTVDQAPAITSANSTTFTEGTLSSFTVMTSGFPKPAISDGGATLPSGVTFVDNGNGTGTLSGTPAAGSSTGSPYMFTFTASNGVSPNATQPFTLTVNTAPVFTSGTSTTFTVGTAGSFTVTATGTPTPTISETGALPSGVTFVGGTGSGTLSGTPATGTGGTYTITIKASNGVGTPASQTFTLTVDQAPAITSANSTTFTEGTLSSFTVMTSGFPKPAISDGGATLPSGVTFVDNGNGTGTLSGTPAAGSSTGSPYMFTFTASNGVSPNATQPFTLTISAAAPACGTGSESLMNGQYTIVLQGFDSGSPAGIGVIFDTDGTGVVAKTVGILDINSEGPLGLSLDQSIDKTQSSLSVGSDHRGCLTIATSSVTLTFRFSLSEISGTPAVASNGHIIEFDSKAITAGVIRKQDTTVTATTLSSSSFAFGGSGGDGKFGVAGVFSTGATGVISTGTIDTNNNGTLDNNGTLTDFPATPSLTFTGTYSIPTPGRGTFTDNFGGGVLVDGILYPVSATELLTMSSDTQSSTSPLFVEKVLKQTKTSFGLGDLSGTDVAYLSGLGSATGASDTQLGIITPNGTGEFGITLYENDGGTLTLGSLSLGSGPVYTVAANGRTLVSGVGKHNSALYLAAPNEGFLVGSGGKVQTGSLDPQSGAPFTAESAKGTYAYGTIQPANLAVDPQSGVADFDGVSIITGTSDDNSSGTLTPNNSFTGNYSIDGTGTGLIPHSGTTCTFVNGDCDLIFIVISGQGGSLPPIAVLMDAKPTNATETNLDPGLKIGDQ